MPPKETPEQPTPEKDQPKGQPKETPKGEQPPKKEPPKPAKPEKKPVKQKKDDMLKYTMTYANGGFNNGVELKPGKDGKIELSIAIYGGGEKKSLGIGNISPKVQKLIKAYSIGAEAQEPMEDITEGLRKYFDQINKTLSFKIIDILQETDEKIKIAIHETFKELK